MRGRTIIVATSYMDEAQTCDRVALLAQGRLIACERPSDLGPDIEKAVKQLLAPQARPHAALAEPAPPPDGGEAIRVDALTRRFGAFTAVDQVSFSVARGEIFGLLGPNGSGKSTIIKMLCGILPPPEGSMQVAGIDVGSHPGAAKGRIGYMSQRFSLYPDLTADENIEFFGSVYGLAGRGLAERRAWVVRLAGLAGHERRLVRSLSGAPRQRLALGCALLHRPEVLFLDEPTSGVDPVSRESFWKLIAEVAAGGTAVLLSLVGTLMPSFLFSGFLFPIATMPYMLQLYTYAFPARYFNDISRDLFLKGAGIEYLWGNVAMLALYAVVLFAAASFALRKKVA
jgi:ABC-2 type transport system ATP-binding protein